MIIDIHAHTTNHKLWNLHTEYATIEVLENQSKIYGIQNIVLLPTYFPLKKSGLPNLELLHRIRGKKLFLAFGSLDVSGNFTAGVSELETLLQEKRIYGIKLYPGYQDFSPSDTKIFSVYELAEKYAVPVMFHGGELHHCCPEKARSIQPLRCGYDHCRLNDFSHLSRPKEMLGAFRNFPRVTFIVSHLANGSFRDLRSAMQQYPNVMTDISGQFLSATSEATEKYRRCIVREIQKFLRLPNGMDRMMFGTDFPIQSYKDSLDLVHRLNLPHVEEEKIFSGNAKRILNLGD